MGKFNFNDLMSDLSKGDLAKPEEKKTEKIVYVDLYNLRPTTENFYDVSNLQDLTATIPLVGILQPLLIKPNEDETGVYDILAGERRWTASKHVVEEMHREDLRKLPCIVKESDDEECDSDIMNGLALIFSNRYREITDYEKMLEVVKLEQLLDLAGEKQSVREVLKQFTGAQENKKEEQLTALTGLKHTQLCRHRKIYNNLCDRLMRKYEKNEFQISVAYEAAGLAAEYQEKAADRLDESGMLTLLDVQMLKKEENEKKPICGQMSLLSTEEKTEESKPIPVRVGQSSESPRRTEVKEGPSRTEAKESPRRTETKESPRRTETKESPSRTQENKLSALGTDFVKNKYGTCDFLIHTDVTYQCGDVVELEETNEYGKTGRKVRRIVQEVIKERPGIEKGYCIIVFQRKEDVEV